MTLQRRAIRKAATILLITTALLTRAYAAEIAGDDKDCLASCARLTGEIASGDLNKLKAILESPARRHSFLPAFPDMEIFDLQLNSRGGSLEEAMKIGRWIRKNPIKIMSSVHSECFSSCVYILAAGVHRQAYAWANDRVGIHRPYLTQMPKEGIQRALTRALAESKAYFVEMNIPEQLADAMFSIPPDKVEILTDEQLAFYRLSGPDIAFEEETQLRAAARYGMSRQQYLQSLKFAEDEAKKCSSLPNLADKLACVDRTFKKYGIHSSQMKQLR